MLKASHWLAIVLGTVALLATGLVISEWKTIRYFASNWNELSQGGDWARRLKSTDDVLDYIAAHPKDVSLAFWKLGEEKNGIFHEADTPRPVASTVKILVLVAYTRAIGQGTLSADEQIALSDWNAFYLPGADGGAHPKALRDLGLRGRLANEKVSLGDLAFSMIRHSDNAAADYLMQRLGRSSIAETTFQLGLGNDSRPHPFAGEMLSWRSTDRSGDDSLRLLGELSPPDYVDLTWSLAARLAHDPDFRAKEHARLERDGPGLTIREQEALAATFSNRGSAREYAKVMQGVYLDELQGAGDKTFELLDWPMTNETVRAEFDTLATKGGSLVGVLTSAYYAKPKGTETGRVLALFFQHVPMAAWEAMRKSFVHQKFEHRLLTDDGFVERVRERLVVE